MQEFFFHCADLCLKLQGKRAYLWNAREAAWSAEQERTLST